MALTREKLKKSQFGLPGKRKYPMPDKKHAANAKRAGQEATQERKAVEIRLRKDRRQSKPDAQTRQLKEEEKALIRSLRLE